MVVTHCLKNNQRGVALLITITVLFVVFALVSEVNRKVRASIEEAEVTGSRAKLLDMATSGVHIGIALLMEDKRTTDIDTVQEIWADPEAVGEVLAELPFEEGAIQLLITDELGKIQINSLVAYPEGREFNASQKRLWEGFLKLLNPPDESVDNLGLNTDIVNSIKDWLDYGDDDATTGINGAENDYYQGLDPPYSCGNGPFVSLDDLILVKGITREMVDRVEMGYRLRDLMTVYGMAEAKQDKNTDKKKVTFTYPGKININTADLPVIMAMMPDDRSDLENSVAAQAIYDYRSDKTEDGFVNALTGTWYLDCPGCEDSGIRSELITTSSDVFSIQCSAEMNKTQRVVQAVVRRDDKKGNYTVLSWSAD